MSSFFFTFFYEAKIIIFLLDFYPKFSYIDCMMKIKAINKYPKVRDEMEPRITRHGGYVWLEPNATKQDKEFYYEVIGLLGPEGAVPVKIDNEWYWDENEVSQK